jgi:hypothetical protein
MGDTTAPMDVRVIIVSRGDASYRVSVFVPGIHSCVWTIVYGSKQMCLTELGCVGLLSPIEVAAAHASDLDERDALLVIRTETEPEVLRAAGFVER